jgi:predicted Zn-dependent peptidase
MEISADGYAEDLDQIDGKTLYEHYRNIFDKGTVKVFFCGDEGEKRKLTAFRKIFQGGGSLTDLEDKKVLPKQEPVFIKENTPMEQARLLLAFDTMAEWGKGSYATMLVLNQLFGGDPDSLLFQNLRERDGLCYDIKSYIYPLTGLLFVQTGIKVENAKEAAVGILKALEELEENSVDEKKLEQAKNGLLRQYNTIADQPWGMVDFSVEQVLSEGERGLNPFLRRIQGVTAEEVSRMANKAKLRTIYLLSGKEAAKNAGK